MRPRLIIAVAVAVAVLTPPAARASGHGPVFALATPTNAQGGWSLDLGLMSRFGRADTGAMFRGMLSYGVTEDLQAAVSFPAVFVSVPLAPARTTALMPATADFEAIVAWRFHRRGARIGTRLESTAYGGIIQPGPQRPAGLLGNLRRAPGAWTAVATGLASRSHYLWGSLAYTRFAESEGDRRPDLLFYSLAWGYRPRAWRKDYPHWDWRVFTELTGENSTRARQGGLEVAGTGGHQIFVGPSTLGIYKNYAIGAGIQFPLFRAVGARQQREKFRFAVNLACFF